MSHSTAVAVTTMLVRRQGTRPTPRMPVTSKALCSSARLSVRFEKNFTCPPSHHRARPHTAEFVDTLRRLLKPGGRLVLTTPYHGYVKNLAIAVLGRWDAHADPLCARAGMARAAR